MGAAPVGEWGPKREWNTHPTKRDVVVLRDSKGGDLDEWPDDTRVREFPKGGAR